MDVLPSQNDLPGRQREGAERRRPPEDEHFRDLLARLAARVDTPSDRRAVVRECRRGLRAAGGDSYRLEVALEAGEFSAIDYLELGEIASASEAVQRALRGEPAGANPYASVPTVHLSAPRIAMYLDGRRDLIGTASVFDRLDAHVAACAACGDAVRHSPAPGTTGDRRRSGR